MSETTRESLRDLMAVFKKHPSREGYLILTVKADAALERARLALSQVDGPGQIIDELRAKLAEAEDVTQRTLKYGVNLEERSPHPRSARRRCRRRWRNLSHSWKRSASVQNRTSASTCFRWTRVTFAWTIT